MAEQISDFDEKLNVIKHNYIKSLNEKFVLLTNLKNSVDHHENINDETSIKAFQEIYENVHKLSGSSAIFGFPKLSEISNRLELLLKEFVDSGCLSTSSDILLNFESLLNEIKNILKEEILGK
jgi:chemotaxis protein histidine kinase CheA